MAVEMPKQDLQVVIWDVVKDVLELFVAVVLCRVICTVRRCVNLHHGCFGVSMGETGYDDPIVDGLPAEECFRCSFAQDKAYSTFVPFFMTRVQDGLANCSLLIRPFVVHLTSLTPRMSSQ